MNNARQFLFNTPGYGETVHRAQIGKRGIGVIQLVIFQQEPQTETKPGQRAALGNIFDISGVGGPAHSQK